MLKEKDIQIINTKTIEIEEETLEELLTITEEVVQIITKIKMGSMKIIFLKVQQSQEITEDAMTTKVIIMTKAHGSKKTLLKK